MPWVNGVVPHVDSNQQLGPTRKWMVSDFITNTNGWNSILIRERFEWEDATSI